MQRNNYEYKLKTHDYSENDGRACFDNTLTSLKEFRQTINNIEEEIEKTDKNYSSLKWLNRPFYAIVYMDGDNMGKLLKENESKFRQYMKAVSERLSKFSIEVNQTVESNYGQLIFAGGDDVNFIIHPEYLLKCVMEINQLYNNYFIDNELTEPFLKEFTLSAGAVVCYHKYPLSSAILGAMKMLKEKAKEFPGKNATAISLIKGHTETLNFVFSNNNIKNLKQIKKYLIKSDISRTTPYRIQESKDLFKSLTDDNSKKKFLCSILSGTRNISKNKIEIEKLAEDLLIFEKTSNESNDGIETMINTLLYARFLAGDK